MQPLFGLDWQRNDTFTHLNDQVNSSKKKNLIAQMTCKKTYQLLVKFIKTPTKCTCSSFLINTRVQSERKTFQEFPTLNNIQTYKKIGRAMSTFSLLY